MKRIGSAVQTASPFSDGRMTLQNDFFSIYDQGFIRIAAGSPHGRVADPHFNAARALEMMRAAHENAAGLLVFPELALSSYAIDDLLHQTALLDAVEDAAQKIIAASADCAPVIAIGAPLRHRGRLYNCALVIHRGRLLGVVPKSYLPNYREFYERRHFASGAFIKSETIDIRGHCAPFGVDLLFAAADAPHFVLGVEICEDMWIPIPPSSRAALAGATVIANLSASDAIVGKARHRDVLCAAHAARCLCAYIYTAAGPGESTTDLAWDGHSAIFENGAKLAQAERFSKDAQLIFADADVEALIAERMRQGAFGDCADLEAPDFVRIPFALDPPREKNVGFKRRVSRFPFVPDDDAQLSELCYEAFNIQAHGLRQRLLATGLKKIVVGISGGLDSTQALLVAATAFDQLNWPRENILGYTLPAYATSKETKANAWRLMQALGIGAREIDLTAACDQMLRDLDHPAGGGAPVYDITFENVQAGARTSLLFRLANQQNALVLGTGDLSELGLGWCTYGVGDHMSHYNVNASVPKTLIQHLIRWCAAENRFGAEASQTLLDILSTEISPELIPGAGDAPAQRTEDFVGPYALQDFNLFYTLRYGFSPRKIAFLAWSAWRDADMGPWPPHFPEDKKVAYDLPTIKKWLEVFLKRFFATSQFKRSALPNGPKISHGGSLSPRGDWRAPSDSSAAAWLKDLNDIP